MYIIIYRWALDEKTAKELDAATNEMLELSGEEDAEGEPAAKKVKLEHGEGKPVGSEAKEKKMKQLKARRGTRSQGWSTSW